MNGSAEASDFSRLADDSRLECRICWYVYDPAVGDDSQQVAAGTPFRELPDYWRCPECDSEPAGFLPVED
jgi:rubredoxin